MDSKRVNLSVAQIQIGDRVLVRVSPTADRALITHVKKSVEKWIGDTRIPVLVIPYGQAELEIQKPKIY